MATATASFNNFFDRRRARLESQRVEDTEDDPEQPQSSAANGTSERAVASSTTGETDHTSLLQRQESGHGDDASENANSTGSTTEQDEDEELGNTLVADRTNSDSAFHQMTLAELEEERELARRRSSACVMFAVFVLFRLWIEAIQDGDFGLLMICLVGTSWTARWIRHNREREEDLDRRINHYIQQQQSGGPPSVDRNDLRMLSFQAQLALAIMESQRQMMENGGYGNDSGNHSPGVSEEAKSRWESFQFKVAAGETKPKSAKGGYGSVSQADDALTKPGKVLDDNDEEPHCSICLCEYEDGETLVKLPCSHFYHGECIDSWTSNHVKCPLCNYDLETAPPESSSDGSIV